jgi:hypothetical protein
MPWRRFNGGAEPPPHIKRQSRQEINWLVDLLSHRNDNRAHQSVSQLQALPLFAFYPQSNREQRLR